MNAKGQTMSSINLKISTYWNSIGTNRFKREEEEEEERRNNTKLLFLEVQKHLSSEAEKIDTDCALFEGTSFLFLKYQVKVISSLLSFFLSCQKDQKRHTQCRGKGGEIGGERGELFRRISPPFQKKL
jgi:hypothetical protein